MSVVADRVATPQTTSPRGWSPLGAAAIAVGVPTAVFAAHAALYGWWVVDDAAITWAYARSVAEGAGPVLQRGVPAAEGFSNPSWLAVFVVVAWLGLPLVTTTKVLAVALAAVTAGGLWSAARAVLASRPAMWAAAVAGSVAALVPSYVIWSASGLEAPLYVAAVAWLAACCARATSPKWAVAAGVLAALAALTRPDGLVYAAAFPIAALAAARWRGLRLAAVSVAVWAVPVAAYLAWRWSRFGLLVPNTAVAKAQGLPSTGPLLELVDYAEWFLAAVALLAVAAWWRRPSARTALLALAGPVVLAAAAYGVLERDWMGQFRFAAPLWPVAALLGVVAVALLGRVLAAVGAVVLAAAVTASATVWAPSALAFRDTPTVPACLVAQINGAEMNAYADAGAVPSSGTLLVPDVGGAALVGRLRVVDLAGLAEPTIAGFMAAGDMAGLRGYVFDQVRPTFVAVHGAWGWQTGVADDPRLARDYELVAQRPDGQVWVRRAAVSPAGLAAMRAARPAQAELEQDVRSAPRAWCPLAPITK